jgi:four helix bundle protein
MRSKGVLAKIEKAAMNVPAKIAYGKAMGQSFGYLKALRQAEGNVHMLSSYLHLMRQLKWISASEFVQLEKEGLRLARKISSLIVILQILLENGN